jgi:hypothetical protein
MKFPSSRYFWPVVLTASALLAACGGTSDETAPGGPALAGSSKRYAAESVPMRSEGSAASMTARADAGAKKMYIVQLAGSPALAYSGDVKGFAATKPQAGQKLKAADAAVVGYMAYLTKRHDDALAAVGGAQKAYSYGYAFNGFAAELTAEQVAKLVARPDVLAVAEDERRQLDTGSTTHFLGLTSSNGFWQSTGARGDNIVIGVIDGGVWPEHPSFDDYTKTPGTGLQRPYEPLAGWTGACQVGEQFALENCSNKLIGARFYNAGYGGADGVRAVLPYEFISPRDYEGHGTHTASTAGGNESVAISGPASVFGRISGVAPRARIAVYKVCWGIGGTPNAGCFNSDSVAAIDQAIADGVDVINFSISGTRTNFLDSVELAFLRAADAGIFVAASAGNAGPTTSTVAHPSPWITTVAAGTHWREVRASATLGNGAVVSGQSAALEAVADKPFIRSTDAGLPGASATAVALCFAAEDNGGVAVLDPAKVAGKIVLCDRGTNARVNKSAAVKAAGGVGMILANTNNNTLNADFHAVPTVHVQFTERAALVEYAATAAPTASIGAATATIDAPAPFTAGFSSRGPLVAGGGDLLKPDIIAPGQDVHAAVAPPGNSGQLSALYSGTSMSSPHIAGMAALLKQLNPTWSPMAIKSAMMTTAYDVLDGANTDPAVIFRQGAGHVWPLYARDPGLVFDSNSDEWIGFLCGTGQLQSSVCASAKIDPSDLNTASIAIGDLVGAQTVTRRVTNVGRRAGTYYPTVTGMAGVDVQVSPPSLRLRRGETKSFTVKFTRTTAAVNAYTGGQLTMTDGIYNVRIPMVVRPVALTAPASINAAATGASYPVTFGFAGPFTAAPRGLVESAVTSQTVADDPTNGACSLATPGAQVVSVTIPAGTTFARFATFNADTNAGSDIDLCVFNAGGTRVGLSAGATAAEEISLSNPAAGVYAVVVQGYSVGAGTPFKLHAWVLGTAAAGNMVVAAPDTAAPGATGTVSLSFSGLEAGKKYLGSIAYGGSTGLPAPTIVRVDP